MFLEDTVKAIFMHANSHMAAVGMVLAIHQDYAQTHYVSLRQKQQIYIAGILVYTGNLWRNALYRLAQKTDPIMETLLCLLLFF